MMMISTSATLLGALLFLAAHCWPQRAAGQQQQVAYTSPTADQLSLIQHHNIPGHYAFEVAPKMEPPSVRKPPYPRSGQVCPGADPFAGLLPKDSLCGDLNLGRVPLNPMGHSFAPDGEPYPFELIKNKTLQFLARALPVLKSEYETIPKVARYMPPNQLLNPTHSASPLASNHMDQLNQRLAGLTGLAPDDYLDGGYQMLGEQGQRRRRRRRKRGAQMTGLTVAELSPNATLVVSSAHSAGRIQRYQQQPAGHQEPSLVITKDGYRSFEPMGQVVGTRLPTRVGQLQAGAELQTKSKVTVGAQQVGKWAAENNGQSQAPQQSFSLAQSGQSNHDKGADQLQASGSQLVARHSSPDDDQPSHDLAANVDEFSRPSQVALDNAPRQTPPSQKQIASHVVQANGAIQRRDSANRQDQTFARRRLGCTDTANGFTSAICQTLSALIEGDQPPVWLTLVKHLGSAYSGASAAPASSDALLGMGPSSPGSIWSLVSSLVGPPSAQSNQEPSGKSSTATRSSLLGLLAPIASLLTGSQSTMARAEPSLVKEAAHLQESSQSTGGNSSGRRERPTTTVGSNSHPLSSAIASALGSSTMAKLAIAGWTSNIITGLVEYFVPSLFQNLATGRSFARRKKPYDPLEQFVDTPLSSQARNSAAGRSQQLVQQPSANNKQPPTPCPSVEEYISPTFARNYQGAWKYVVQIPHEGYFTQTIQRTSCLRQKCEFTDGQCHESPRWVSLLVAEIYYPNTIFGGAPVAQPMGATQQQTAASQPQPSLSEINGGAGQLNQAFANVAHELGLDLTNPAGIQQLANAYSYQLLQRNGQPTVGQQLESRASPSFVAPPIVGQPQASASQQIAAQVSANPALQGYQSDYITALAAATLRQNPNMSIQELISSLSMLLQSSPIERRKRDLGHQQRLAMQQAQQQQQQQQGALVAQHRAESPVSVNDLIGGLQSAPAQGPAQFGKMTTSESQQPGSAPSLKEAGGQQQAVQAAEQQQPANGQQVECDGHDRLGCYVVRVYYDWFLVNGSCKCWKTSHAQGSQSGQTNGNSFIRRIFTG